LDLHLTQVTKSIKARALRVLFFALGCAALLIS
jgi:hypothetical protein